MGSCGQRVKHPETVKIRTLIIGALMMAALLLALTLYFNAKTLG